MNTLEAKIQSEITSAMKNKDEIRLATNRAIKTKLMEIKTAVGGKKDLDDIDIIKAIKTLAKQRTESAEIYEANGRMDIATKERAELAILNEYLPKMLSEEEIQNIVNKTIIDIGATNMKDMGKVMGFLNKTYAGQIDGSVVSKYVKARLA